VLALFVVHGAAPTRPAPAEPTQGAPAIRGPKRPIALTTLDGRPITLAAYGAPVTQAIAAALVIDDAARVPVREAGPARRPAENKLGAAPQ
jgi:hypothetical protein